MANALTTDPMRHRHDFLRADPAGTSAELGVALEVVDSLDAAKQAWRALEPACARTPFQTFDWHRLQQNEILATRQPTIVIGRAPAGVPLFILPLGIERRGPVNVLTWLARRQTSYCGGLFHPATTALLDATATARLVERIATLVPEAHAMVLPDQRDDDESNPFRRLPRVRGAGIGHSITLAPWGVLYAARGNRRTRHNDRRREKRLAEFAPWQARIAEHPDDRTRLMQIMFQQKRIWMRERGIEDFLADGNNRALLLAAASAPAASAVAPLVACLEVAGETVAVSFGLSQGPWHYSLITSVHPGEAYRPFTPGEILFRHVLKYACDRGMESFDLGIGTTLQKEQYADQRFRLFHTLVPLTVPGRFYVAALRAQLAVKRLIKETPVMWELFQRLRRLRADVPGRSGGSAAG